MPARRHSNVVEGARRSSRRLGMTARRRGKGHAGSRRLIQRRKGTWLRSSSRSTSSRQVAGTSRFTAFATTLQERATTWSGRRVSDLLELEAGVNTPFRFHVRIEMGDGKLPEPEAAMQANRILRNVKADLEPVGNKAAAVLSQRKFLAVSLRGKRKHLGRAEVPGAALPHRLSGPSPGDPEQTRPGRKCDETS